MLEIQLVLGKPVAEKWYMNLKLNFISNRNQVHHKDVRFISDTI